MITTQKQYFEALSNAIFAGADAICVREDKAHKDYFNGNKKTFRESHIVHSGIPVEAILRPSGKMVVLDFDDDNWLVNKQLAEKAITYFKNNAIPFELIATGGRGLRIHIYTNTLVHENYANYEKKYLLHKLSYHLWLYLKEKTGLDTDKTHDFGEPENRDENHCIRPIGSLNDGKWATANKHFYYATLLTNGIIPDERPKTEAKDIVYPTEIEKWDVSQDIVDEIFKRVAAEASKPKASSANVVQNLDVESIKKMEEKCEVLLNTVVKTDLSHNERMFLGSTYVCIGAEARLREILGKQHNYDKDTTDTKIKWLMDNSAISWSCKKLQEEGLCKGNCANKTEKILFPSDFAELNKAAIKQKNEENFKVYIQDLLLARQRNPAIYQLSERLLEKEHIQTIRDDNIEEVWIYRNGIYEPNGKCYIREFCKDMCGAGYQKSIAEGVIAHIVASTYIEMDTFFKNENIDEIAVKNGVLNVRSKELLPFTPEKRFFSKINAEYDLNAPKNEKLHTFISSIVSKNDADILQELFGYYLYKRYFIHKAFLFVGFGRNGKGRILELSREFLGAQNYVSMQLQALSENNFAASELFLKSACFGADLSATALKETDMFKMLSGDDSVTCDRKFKSKITFKNFAKLVFSANEVPRSPDTSDGYMARWIIIDFPNQFYSEKQIEQMKVEGAKQEELDKISIADRDVLRPITTPEGMNGMLLWALAGLDRLLENGDFSHSETTKKVRERYLLKSDSFAYFCSLYIEESVDGKIQKSELKSLYSDFCGIYSVKQKNEVVMAKVLKSIYSDVETGQHEVSGNRFYSWDGISFKIPIEEIRNGWGIKDEKITTLEKLFDFMKQHENDERLVPAEKIFETCEKLFVLKALQDGDIFEPFSGYFRRN